MDIRQTLKSRQSKANMLMMVDHIDRNPDQIDVLIAILLSGDYVSSQRAAWPMSVVAEKRPELLVPHLSSLVDQLPRKDVHNAVKRNVLRLFQFVEIPQRLQGRIYSHCLDLIADPNESTGVKAFSLKVAERIARKEPALIGELRLVARPLIKDAPPGIRVRLREIFQ